MTRAVLIAGLAAVSMLAAVQAHARLGETKSICDKRYGGIENVEDSDPLITKVTYKGRTVWFARPEGDEEMTAIMWYDSRINVNKLRTEYSLANGSKKCKFKWKRVF